MNTTISRARNESGMSLIELTVVLLLMSVVGALMLGFLSSVLNTTTRATNDTETEKSIQFAMRPVTENIRSSDTIAVNYPSSTSCPSGGSYPSGYSNCLAFWVLRPAADNLSCPQSYFVYGLKSDGVLREDRTDFNLVSGTCSTTASYTGRPLLKNIVNGSTPLFTYFDTFGNKLDPNASGQTTYPFKAAATVRVSLSTRYQTNSPLLSYTSDLALRNNR